MRPTQCPWLGIMILALLLCSFGSVQKESRAQQPASPSAADETALRTLAEEFFAAYAKKDLEGYIRLWSTNSPDLASRQQAMQQFFAAHEQITIKNVTVRQVIVAGEKAKLRIEAELNAVEIKTGKPATGLGKRIRVLHSVKEAGAWKVWREVAAVEELAAALVAAKTEQERNALLAEEPELVSVELRIALLTLGNQLRSQNKLEQALFTYQLARDTAERIGDQVGLAGALHNLGDAYRLQGNEVQAIEHYQKSLRLSEGLGNKTGMARTLNNLGLVYHTQGNYVQAIEHYQQSLTLNEGLGYQAGIAAGLYNLGRSHNLQGSYAQALECFQKCLTLYETMGEKGDIADTLNYLGIIYYKQGNYIQALEHYQKSLPIFEVASAKEEISRVLNNLGVVYYEQGNYAQAQNHYQKSLTLSDAVGDREGSARALNNLGNIYRSQGDYAQTLVCYQKSLTIFEALKNKDEIARVLGNLGMVHDAQGNYAQAMEYHRKSLAMREELGDKQGIAMVLANLGENYAAQGNYAQALESAHRAATLAQQINSPDIFWNAQLSAGRAYRALKQFSPARQAFEAAIVAIETLRTHIAGGEQEQQHFFEDKLAPYQAMVELLTTQNQTTEALAFAERAKARVLLDVLSSGRRNLTKAMTTKEQEQEQKVKNQLVSLNTQIAREGLNPQPDATRLRDLKAQLQKVRLEYEAFQTTLYVAHPELKAQRGEAMPLTLEQAQALLPEANSALLEYVVSEEKTSLFVITQSKTGAAIELKVYPIAITRKELTEHTMRFRTSLAKGDLSFRSSASDLYDLLLKPAAAQLQGKSSLIIVPDGTLWELPFQALQPTPNHYLLEDAAIAYAPSLTALREMQKLRGQPKPGAPTLLAFGNPALGKQTIARAKSVLMDEKLEPLPEAEKQVKALQQIYGIAQSHVYTGAEAREERAKAEAGGYRILHLATHGILNDSSPLYSHVLLAQAEGNSQEDGLLEAWEIMNLDLKADLAVLSACETARGRVGAGEGMIGLSWALFVAGCPTTVVSQWKVDAASTTELMIEFHRQLKAQMTRATTPFSTARALREAALKLQRNAQYRHPFYWAGFVVAGKGF